MSEVKFYIDWNQYSEIVFSEQTPIKFSKRTLAICISAIPFILSSGRSAQGCSVGGAVGSFSSSRFSIDANQTSFPIFFINASVVPQAGAEKQLLVALFALFALPVISYIKKTIEKALK